MRSIRLRLAAASAALAAVLQATMPERESASRGRVYAVRVAEAEPRGPIFLTRLPRRVLEKSLW